jgi:translation initiation factor 2B subunit (eIF-2B alpha/beta/delta family)
MVGTTLRDLYVLRAEALGAQQQGMDVSDLIEAIDALDNKLLEEAKQNISIEEIAKLQEEFVSSLDKENAV